VGGAPQALGRASKQAINVAIRAEMRQPRSRPRCHQEDIMSEQSIDHLFLVIAAVFAAWLSIFPKSFIYLASYGGRISYKPPKWIMWTTRITAGAMLVFILRDLLL
jgi:hypothetical protein